MNLIVIVLDSFRQDHVSTYHQASSFGNYFRQQGGAAIVKGIQGKYEIASGSVE